MGRHNSIIGPALPTPSFFTLSGLTEHQSPIDGTVCLPVDSSLSLNDVITRPITQREMLTPIRQQHQYDFLYSVVSNFLVSFSFFCSGLTWPPSPPG